MSDAGRAGRAGSDTFDIFGPLERSGIARGLLLIVGAVVVGALLIPSATRPGLGTTSKTAASETTPPSAGPAVTVPPTTVPTTATSVPVSGIEVLVANGTNTNGAAAAVTSVLSKKGFATLTPVDALLTVTRSQVYVIGTNTAAAQEVASALGLSAAAIQPSSTPVPVASTGNAVVVVVVGPDLATTT